MLVFFAGNFFLTNVSYSGTDLPKAEKELSEKEQRKLEKKQEKLAKKRSKSLRKAKKKQKDDYIIQGDGSCGGPPEV